MKNLSNEMAQDLEMNEAIGEDVLDFSYDFSDEEIKGKNALSIYMKDISGYGLLTKEEYEYYGKRLASGDPIATEKFIVHNAKWVLRLAKERQKISPLQMDELVCAGNIGLIQAAKTFDFSRGAKFSAHAANYIKAAMIREEENTARAIRLPSYLVQQKNKVNNAIEKLTKMLDREPTVEEIANESGLKISQVKRVKMHSFKMYSVDHMVGSEGEEGIDFIDSGFDVEDDYAGKERSSLIMKALSNLNEDEKTVVKLRFFNKETHVEIGKILNMKTTEVKSLEKSSLNKMKEALLDLGIDTALFA